MKLEKVIGAVPDPLDPDTVYLVRTGSGFSLLVSDTTGVTAHPLNLPTFPEGGLLLSGEGAPAGVAANFSDDFESGTTNWPTVIGVTTGAGGFTGNAATISPANSASYLGSSTTRFPQSRRYAVGRARVRFGTLPPPGVTADVITLQNAIVSANFDLFVSATGTWRADLATGDTVDSGIPVVANQWYLLEWFVDYGSTTYTARFRIDGVEFEFTSSGRTTSTVRALLIGTTATTKTYQFRLDDVAIATSTTPVAYIGGVVGEEGDFFIDTLTDTLYGPYVGSSWGAGVALGGAPELVGPAFTYTGGVLTSITYDDGSTKTFTYTGGVLTQLDTVVGGVTTRKTFNYVGGVLTSIDQAVL